ncbi:MAG: DUF4153 domain-containing protein [Clostridiaceae bacterium]
MGRISGYMKKMMNDIRATFSRFASVPVFLAAITVLVSLQIEEVFTDDRQQIVERIIFSLVAGAFFGATLEFVCERFGRLKKYRIYLQGITLIFSLMYYIFMSTEGKIEFIATIRLIVICFSLFAFYIWIPSYKNRTIFSNNALAHFKACFISLLYSLVLSLGLIAIYFAIDLLLVKLDNDIPAHIANVMGIFFFPLYYLALLPDFNSSDEQMLEKSKASSVYPKFLEILVSYIALPLITLFTAVLAIYLVKIVVTLKWPVGQLGPMLLWYSAVGLFLYVLCGKLENRFTQAYRKFFPIALIPLVLMQLYSVFIRVNAYGITESRYYLILFGIYSIVCAVALILSKGNKPGVITVFAAAFAIVSLIPPVDAFSISRASQTNRLENIMKRNNMFSSGKPTPKVDIPLEDKAEITNIMNYMYRMGHTSKVSWLPSGYNHYKDFQKVFGFEEQYGTVFPEPTGVTWYNGMIEQNLPIDIAGYATALKSTFYESIPSTEIAFDLGGKAYKLNIRYLTDDVEFSIVDSFNKKQAVITLKPRLEKLLTEQKINQGSTISPADLTIDASGSDLKMRVILQSINFRKEIGKAADQINGEALILIGEK